MGKSKEGVTGETCTKELSSGSRWNVSWKPCDKPAKGTGKNGKPLCGVHLAAERRRDATDKKYRANWDAARAFREEVESFAHEHVALGIFTNRHETRTVMVSFDALKALVARLS